MSTKFKSLRPIRYVSQQQLWVNNSGTKLTFTGWVPVVGPSGRRIVIDEFEVHFIGNVTVATATSKGQDLYRLINAITVEQVDAVKRYDELPGDALRVINYLTMGAARVREAADFAVGTGALIFSAHVPIYKPFTKNPYDFSMPAENFKQVQIGMGISANISQGTSVFTINSGAYYVVAVCHEEAQGHVFSHAIDTILSTDFPSPSTVQMTLNMTGRVHDQALYCPGLKGGQLFMSQSAPLVTQAQIVGVYPQAMLLFPDLTVAYEHERGETPKLFGAVTQSPLLIDPFVPDPADGSGSNASTNPRAIALQMSNGNSPDEGPVVNNIVLNLVETAAPPGNLRVVSRICIPRNPNLDRSQGQRNGKSRKAIAPTSEANAAPVVMASDQGYHPAKLV